SSTDPAGHPTTLERADFPHRVAAVVDANRNRTQFRHDARGLPTSKAVMGKEATPGAGDWSGDPPSSPTEVYEYDFTSTPARITVKTRQVREGATFDVHQYLDGRGNVVQERHTAEPHPNT